MRLAFLAVSVIVIMGCEQASKRSTTATPASTGFSYRILHWNVDSDGNEPALIADQLGELIDAGDYHVLGLSEVHDPEVYEQALTGRYPDRYSFVRGETGSNNGRKNDRLWMAYDRNIFELVESEDMEEVGGFNFKDGRHRAPLYVKLKDKANGREVVFIQNHLVGENADFRQQQAAALREWARTQSMPIIAIGDYNLDYEFATEKGNAAFDELMKDDVWRWIKPAEMIDTHWIDDGQGGDRYPDAMLNFNFVAGSAKHWGATCRVIVRDGDFPDDESTSDHRPVELILPTFEVLGKVPMRMIGGPSKGGKMEIGESDVGRQMDVIGGPAR